MDTSTTETLAPTASTVHDECMEIVNSADAPVVAPKAVVENGLKGVDFCFTGVFDCGGGTGLKRGKDGLKKLTERAGGNYRTSITKKTKYLVAGARPGGSKVEQAHNHETAIVIAAAEVEKLLEDPTHKPVPAVFNDNTTWSAGYNGNGKGYVYNPTSPAYSPTCPDGIALADYKPTRPEERFAPDVDAMKANRLLSHEERCDFMSPEYAARNIAMAEASKRPNKLQQLRAQEDADVAKAMAASVQ